MKTALSTGFRLTALASLGFWWFWFMAGSVYYYTVEGASVWPSLTSGAGMALVICVLGAFSALLSDAIHSP